MNTLFYFSGNTNKNDHCKIELKGCPDYFELVISLDARIVGSCTISMPPGIRVDDLEHIPQDRLRDLVKILSSTLGEVKSKYLDK